MLKISHLFIYPIKSLGGIELTSSKVEERGLQYDRRWMLIDEQNRFITQREHTQLALLRTAITSDHLEVFHISDSSNKIRIPLQYDQQQTFDINIWEDVCPAIPVSKEIDQWFSETLKQAVRLVYMPDESRRHIDPDYAFNQEITSFSDGYPILIIGQASLDDLNAKLNEPIGMDRFRPNIVFTGGEAFCEDAMRAITIGDVKMMGVKNCARCIMTTTDQQTGERSSEPLATLSTYRKRNNKIYFGQNVIPVTNGIIQIGDILA
jgi:uncharacterized protein YcbX